MHLSVYMFMNLSNIYKQFKKNLTVYDRWVNFLHIYFPISLLPYVRKWESGWVAAKYEGIYVRQGGGN